MFDEYMRVLTFPFPYIEFPHKSNVHSSIKICFFTVSFYTYTFEHLPNKTCAFAFISILYRVLILNRFSFKLLIKTYKSVLHI